MKAPPPLGFRRLTKRFVVIGALAVAMTSASLSIFADPPTAATADGGIHSLGALPQAPATLPTGPHQDVYMANCLVCHSNRYVFMQPKFTRQLWEAEVTKMAHTYGAPIPPEQRAQIVEYLYAIRGKPNPAMQTVPGGDSSALRK